MCHYLSFCWRNAYSRFLLDKPWQGSPPDRLTLFLQGYAVDEMLPKGGIFCESMPFQDSTGKHNLCPLVSQRGDYKDCQEYKKEARKNEWKAKADHRRKARERVRQWLPKEVRRMVAKRDKYRCVYCGRSVHEIGCHVDHIVPLSMGGSNEESNLALSCVDCNQAKGAKVWQFGCRKEGV